MSNLLKTIENSINWTSSVIDSIGRTVNITILLLLFVTVKTIENSLNWTRSVIDSIGRTVNIIIIIILCVMVASSHG